MLIHVKTTDFTIKTAEICLLHPACPTSTATLHLDHRVEGKFQTLNVWNMDTGCIYVPPSFPNIARWMWLALKQSCSKTPRF